MAQLALFNEGVPGQFFSPYGGTHNEAPKRKNVATLTLNNAYLWLHWPFSVRGYQTIFIYGGNHNEAPRRNVLEPLGSKRLSEAKECKGRMVTLLQVHEIGYHP